MKTCLKAIIISLFDYENFDSFYADETDIEMRNLASSANIDILNNNKIIIKVRTKTSKTYLSVGKIQEIKEEISLLSRDAQAIVFNRDFNPTQQRNLEDEFELKIISKTELIYQIFLARCQSKPAKIQLELANLKYLKTRLTGSYDNFDRIRGGIGLKGPGETKLEVDRRTLSKRIHRLEKQLTEIEKNLKLRMDNRKSEIILSLVGYTNAGKTSVLNLLTRSHQLSENELFTTTDVKSKRMFIPPDSHIIVSDTIGFIRDLPAHLVESFKTTLLEISVSSIIAIVVDSSSLFADEHIKIVLDMLETLRCSMITKIFIFNKIDLLPLDELTHLKQHIKKDIPDNPYFFISTKTKEGVDDLLQYLTFFVNNATDCLSRVNK